MEQEVQELSAPMLKARIPLSLEVSELAHVEPKEYNPSLKTMKPSIELTSLQHQQSHVDEPLRPYVNDSYRSTVPLLECSSPPLEQRQQERDHPCPSGSN